MSSLYHRIGEVPPADRIVTIGTFDGVHRGHQYLIGLVVDRARALGMRSLVVTFEPVPASVLRPESFRGRVATSGQKFEAIARLGVDDLLVVTFDHDMAAQSPDQFMAALVEQAGLCELWVGDNFALGKGRSGDVARLTEIGGDLGFIVHPIARKQFSDQPVSSSAVREAVACGDVAKARRLLGRPFRVSGEVIHGAHLGRTIGFPTANVEPPRDLVALADGIYVALATLPGEADPRPAMTYVGTRPTVNTGSRLVETHVLDFDGDLYGQVIEVDVLERLRADQTFPGLEALVEQLHRDEAATRAFLAADPETKDRLPD